MTTLDALRQRLDAPGIATTAAEALDGAAGVPPRAKQLPFGFVSQQLQLDALYPR
jgi:hypothetical protein